jgi:hypothetical protein
MALVGPGFRHREVVWLEPGRGTKTLGFLFLSLIAIGVLAWCLLYHSGGWPAEWSPDRQVEPGALLTAARVAAAAAVACLLAVAWNGYGWYVGREVVRLASDDSTGAYTPRKASGPSGGPAPVRPELTVAWAPKPRRPRQLRPVGRRYNVIGEPPLHIGYLRVFENNARARAFAGDAWREFGYVYLLRSATAVRPRELRRIKRDPAGELVTDHASLQKVLRAGLGAPLRRGLHVLLDLSPYPVWTWDWYGAYPVVTPLCHGSFWRDALDHLLTQMDVVLLDLSGLRRGNEGTFFEIQRVIDRYPVERVLFLIDPRSKDRFVREVIHVAWDRMDADSPNAGPGRKRAAIAWTDRFVTEVTQNGSGGETRRTRLRAQRRRTRKLAAWMQARIATAPPVPRMRSPLPVVPVDLRPADRRRHISLMPAVLGTGVLTGLLATTVLYTAAAAKIDAAPPSASPSTGTAEPTAPPVPPAEPPTTPKPPASSSESRPTPAVVPDVRDMSVEEARQALGDARLTPGEQRSELSPKEAGAVIRTEPAGGTTVKEGSVVDLVPASGENAVPNVRGKGVDAATTELTSAGFLVQSEVVPVEDGTDSTVLEQKPGGGEEQPVGTTVTILVSRVHEPTPTPAATPTPTPTPVPPQEGEPDQGDGSPTQRAPQSPSESAR